MPQNYRSRLIINSPVLPARPYRALHRPKKASTARVNSSEGQDELLTGCEVQLSSRTNPGVLSHRPRFHPHNTKPTTRRFERANQRVLGVMKVFCRVLVCGRVAAPNVSAFEAEPQMHPRATHFRAFFANVGLSVWEFDLIEMFA